MRIRSMIPSLLIAVTVYGADPVEVDLSANPGTPRTYAVEVGDFDFKLTNVLPNKTYEIVNESRKGSKKIDLGSPAAEAACENTDAQIARVLEAKLKEKKSKAKEADKATTELSEADIAEVLKGDFGCTVDMAKLKTDKAKFEADKKKYDEDKQKFDAGTAKPESEKTRLETEKTRLDTEKTRLDALDARVDTLNKIRERFNITFDGYSLKAGDTLQKTFKRSGEDAAWTVVVATQGGSAAAIATAATKAANPIAAESVKLNDLTGRTQNQPELIIGSCKYSDARCNPIYVNADQVSTLTIIEIPRGEVTIKVVSGDFFPCEAVRYNIARYQDAPNTLSVPLNMKKGVVGIGSLSVHKAEAEAAAIYHLDWCPGTNRVLNKTNMFVNDPEQEDLRDAIKSRELLTNTQELSDLSDPRTREFKDPAVASLPLFLRGRATQGYVEFTWADGRPPKTLPFTIVYQRFWLDAGGFFVFSRRTDQSIDLENLGGTPERQLVRAVRRDVSIEPATGIVINVHPGNFPILAFQFGIAATQGKLPSYYGGIGLRAREVGKRGLATLGVGVAMQQEDHFPNIENLGIYESTSPRLKPVAKYGLTFPYISFSLGFSFGGVSEKTNVADPVQQPQ